MIYIRTESEIAKLKESNRINYLTLLKLGNLIEPGITTRELDAIAESFIRSEGGRPAFKGYNGFPASICASINEEVVHGIPSDRIIQDGDIIGIDVGVEKDGYYGDAAMTFAVGKITDAAQRLMDATRESLYKGIEKAILGNRLSDIGHAVQKHVEGFGYSVVRTLVGHGIGEHLHEEPEVPNFGVAGKGPLLKPGMVLAIEPMVNIGGHRVVTDSDGWTVRTADRSLSAHFEHSIVITEDGPFIMGDNIEKGETEYYGKRKIY
ncbi:MAG: type I methionyl aminopeptidase [Candidatus Marinimicrobia bacterium]|nr:type I methionyl aminopeptidase [Candidatus Neomarinimicrobiota bacterium]